MTPKLTLFFLAKNYQNNRIGLAEKLEMPRSTLYAILNHSLKSMKNEHINNIDRVFEELREQPILTDISLYIPSRIPRRWRFAARDSFNVWTIYDSDYPPVYTQLGWHVPGYARTPTMTLNPDFIKIPADRDSYHDHLYQRDLLTGVWVKTERPTTIFLNQQQPPTHDDWDRLCDTYLKMESNPEPDNVSNMLEMNPLLKEQP